MGALVLPSWLQALLQSWRVLPPKKYDDKTEHSQEASQESLIGANWPSLPVPADSPRTILDTTQDSPIQPAQKSPTPWKGQQRGPADYERDRVEKYAKYFKGNEILPIPELVEKLTPRILSLVVSDLKTKRLVGLKKETFEELLRKAGIPCQYFCRKSFATWDVLLPTEDQAAMLAANNITTKYFRLQPEYRGTRRLRVTICNGPASITGEVLAAYLSSYGQVEEYNLLRSPAGTAYEDYAFRLCLTRDGFKAIPEILISGDRQMIVMVEGRRPRCWSCKQIGHISKFCPKKTENAVAAAAAAAAATTTTTASTATTTISKIVETQDPSQGQPKTNDKEGWSEVTRKRRGSPKQGEKSLIASPPQNQTKTPEPAAATTAEQATTPTTKKGPQTPTTTKTTATSTTPVSATLAKKKKGKKNKEDHEKMETSTNLKRRRDSGEGAATKVCAGPSGTEDPLEGPSNAYPQKQPLPQQVPMQVPLMAPFPPLSLPPPPLPLPPMFPPQYCIPQNATPESLQPPQYLQPPLPPPQPPQPPLPTETPPFHPQLKNFRRHQIVHIRRAQSLERPSPQKLLRSLSLPSLSLISSPELFPEQTPIHTNPQTTSSQHQKEAANNAELEQQQKAKHLCTVGAEAVTDHQLKKMLKPLLQLEKVGKKKVNNPLNSKSAAMVTTFIRSAGDRTKGVWKFLDTVRQTDTGVKLAELEHSSLKRCLPFCSGRVPILVHPSFYRALKIRFPLDVGGVSRDGRVNTELGTGSLRQAVGILTPGDFRPIVDPE